MPRQTEPNANNALGSLLQDMLPRSQVRSENTQAISGHPSLRPDIIVTAPGRSPVVVEAEYMPARTVEPEARERLGLEVAANGRIIEAAIALRYPDAIGDAHDLRAAISSARLEYCVFTESAGESRFPESGWLDGSVEDLADMVRLVSEPQRAVDEATTTLQQGIDGAAKLLDELNETRSGITLAIARLLGMTNVPQTRRMACAIIANALVFHERIAGMHDEVKPLALVCGDSVPNPQGEVIAAWNGILDINYWAIFAIAKDILQQLPSVDAANVLRRLRNTAQSVNATGVDNAHDLTGRIFQRLIADRKYLATFYTLPASAALLARLAVAKLCPKPAEGMDGIDWSSPEAIGKLRIADFACGTGALLSAVYEQIAARHERAGGDAEALHKLMMEEVLYGCDVMPSAVHITGSTPLRRRALSPIQRLPPLHHALRQDEGRQCDDRLPGASPVLRRPYPLQHQRPCHAHRKRRRGDRRQVRAEIPDASYDLVIMNPPFTRATNHEGAHADITNPAFAAFDATDDDQTGMGRRVNRLGDDTCYHGNAGIASAFAALAHKKLKPGGVLALVLPLSATAGLSWQGFRRMLGDHYTGLTVLTIAAASNDALSFSSDTGLAECLVIARRLNQNESPNDRAHFTSLIHRPQGFAYASSLSASLLDGGQVRRIEDGPYGGTQLRVGEGPSGETITIPRSVDGDSWRAVRLSDHSLAQAAHALSQSKLWPPGSASSVELKTALLGDLAKLGLVDRDITGPAPRGPFDRAAPSPTATYPALWSHNAKKETHMACAPDSQLHVRKGMEEKAAKAWSTASRVHISRGFRFNSQPLAVAFTEQQSAGGRAWPNVRFINPLYDFTFAIWGNSTLGMLLYWWHSNLQVAGRGDMTIRSVNSLPVLDLRTLSKKQLHTAEDIFNELRDKELKPAYLADADPNRALLDRRVICDLLGFDDEVYTAVRRLSAKWCAEPSVHGGKPRPNNAKLVV